LYATANAARRLAEEGVALALEPEIVRPDVIARRLGPDAVHNGLLAEADALPSPELEQIEPAGLVLVLDQITDPHNLGAILRPAHRGPLPPHRGRVRRRGGRHHRPPQPGSNRRARQGRLGCP